MTHTKAIKALRAAAVLEDSKLGKLIKTRGSALAIARSRDIIDDYDDAIDILRDMDRKAEREYG